MLFCWVPVRFRLMKAHIIEWNALKLSKLDHLDHQQPWVNSTMQTQYELCSVYNVDCATLKCVGKWKPFSNFDNCDNHDIWYHSELDLFKIAFLRWVDLMCLTTLYLNEDNVNVATLFTRSICNICQRYFITPAYYLAEDDLLRWSICDLHTYQMFIINQQSPTSEDMMNNHLTSRVIL